MKRNGSSYRLAQLDEPYGLGLPVLRLIGRDHQ